MHPLMQYIAALAALAIALTAVSISIAVVSWTRSRRSYRCPFALLMLAEVVIVWGYFMDVAATELGNKLFWNSVEYVGYLSALPLFLFFAVQFSGTPRLDLRRAVVVSIPAVVFFVTLLTNPYHHLFYESVAISANPYRSIDAVYGPAFLAYVAYALAMLFAGVAILLRHYLQTSMAHRRSVGTVLFASILAVAVVMLNYISIYSIPGSFLVILGFMASGVMFLVGAFGMELFRMVPFALERVMETMRGAVLILDDQDRALYLNPSAECLVGKGGPYYLEPVTQLLPSLPSDALTRPVDPDPVTEDVHELSPGRFFDVRVFKIQDQGGFMVGKIVTLREVTAQKVAEAEAREAQDKLGLMNSITRHDILNQLTALEGHAELAMMRSGPGKVQEHLAAIQTAAGNIAKQIEFARDYQDMGAQEPNWQNVEELFLNASRGIGMKGTTLDLRADMVELLADPLLTKVFYNLLDNSLQHGGGVTRIEVRAVETGMGLELVYSDDGDGIPEGSKPHIFEKGFGKNTGLGLFLSREIVRRSGMTLVEDGVPGQGARFVIRAPPGRYRFPGRGESFQVQGHIPAVSGKDPFEARAQET